MFHRIRDWYYVPRTAYEKKYPGLRNLVKSYRTVLQAEGFICESVMASDSIKAKQLRAKFVQPLIIEIREQNPYAVESFFMQQLRSEEWSTKFKKILRSSKKSLIDESELLTGYRQV